MSDPYEQTPYPGFPFPQTHPDRLFTVAALHGVEAAPPQGASVLELGCGDGLNLVAIAASLPGSRTVGIDRAAGPLARGRSIAADLGLDHVELRAADLLDMPAEDLGTFDYVIAHGVYSWVPADVRDALLATIGRSLAPGGVAFVSYNALPGCHIRRAVRDLMRFHIGDTAAVDDRVSLAREALAFAERFGGRTDPYGRAFEHELERVSRLSVNSLVHDDLADVWEPVHLVEFVAHAERHGLGHLADAELIELRHARFPDGVDAALDELAGGDPVRREQYGDLIAGRAFRQTLLVHADVTRAPRPVPDRVDRLHFAGSTRPDPLGGGYASVADAVLAALADRSPETATVAEVAEAAGVPQHDAAAALLGLLGADMVEVYARRPTWTFTVDERPAAAPITRLLAGAGTGVLTLDHRIHPVADPVARRAITLMDGSRDAEGLLDGLMASVGDELVIETEDGSDVDPEALRAALRRQLDDLLPAFAAAKLLLRQDGG